MLDWKRVLAAKPKNKPIMALGRLSTAFGEEVLAACAADAGYVPRAEHPRPQFERASYRSLNGRWTCAFAEFPYDPLADTREKLAAATPPAVVDTPILVPFSPEADLSHACDVLEPREGLHPGDGGGDSPVANRQLKPGELLWYRGSFAVPQMAAGERCLLHFEGVDDTCAVWCNGVLLGMHQGGYIPFEFDITEALRCAAGAGQDAGETAGETAGPEGESPLRFTLELAVTDPSEQGIQLRGKQTLNRSDLWYTAQSGIWQPVWLEVVPAAHVCGVEILPDAKTGMLTVKAQVTGLGAASSRDAAQGLAQGQGAKQGAGEFRVTIFEGSVADAALACESGAAFGEASFDKTAGNLSHDSQPRVLAEATASVEASAAAPQNGTACVQLQLSEAQLRRWSPDNPYLYPLEFRFGQDVVRSYCAFRTVEVRADDAGVTRFFLNDQPLFQKGVLDQGYWPESHMTAPTDAALAFDIAQMKACGFNMLRKHIKVESDRYYYHCDRLGMLVWQDMVTGGGTYDEVHAMYAPSLVSATWGHYSDTNPRHQRKLAAGNPRYQAIWRRTMRETIGFLRNHPSVVTWVLFNESWGQFDSVAACRIARKLDPTRPIEAVSGWYDQGAGDYFGVHNYFRDLEVYPDKKGARLGNPRACVTCEFGGLVCNVAGHAQLPRSFGYEIYDALDDWRAAVQRILAHMDGLEAQGMAGYVYTQLSDVEEETNGILTYDRKVNKLK